MADTLQVRIRELELEKDRLWRECRELRERIGRSWRGALKATTSDAALNNPLEPTDAELDAAFGTPADLGNGFIGILDDGGAGITVWLCVTKRGAWWYEKLTEAV